MANDSPAKNDSQECTYEAPQLTELGEFDDLTRGVGFPLFDFFVAFD